MYNIWCEVKKENIVLVVIGIVMTIISFFVDKTSETIFLLILTLALIFTLLKSISKYNSLKKNGVLLNNLPYHFENISNNEKVMIVEFEYQGNNYKLFKKQKNWNGIPDNGVTNVILNTNKPNEYYIFLPQ
jgi:c-di-AMP phosphodiesterase-like protein